MSINSGKHVIKEIQEVRCTVVETGVSEARVKFLKELLELNGYEVKSEEEVLKPIRNEQGEEVMPPTSFIIGVTDLVFNPVIQVYERVLRTKKGTKVTPDYWNQKTEKTEPNYWDLSLKN